VANAGPGTISVGALAGYKSYSWDYTGGKSTLRSIYVGTRGAYHYGFGNPRLDTYGGVGVGLHVVSYAVSDSFDRSNNTTTSSSQTEVGVFVGARYFLAENFGAFAELGTDTSYLKLGLTARF
jgi:hypothetical protein